MTPLLQKLREVSAELHYSGFKINKLKNINLFFSMFLALYLAFFGGLLIVKYPVIAIFGNIVCYIFFIYKLKNDNNIEEITEIRRSQINNLYCYSNNTMIGLKNYYYPIKYDSKLWEKCVKMAEIEFPERN